MTTRAAHAPAPSASAGYSEVRHRWQLLDGSLGTLSTILMLAAGLVVLIAVVSFLGIAFALRGEDIAIIIPIIIFLAVLVILGVSLLLGRVMISSARGASKVVSRFTEVGKPRVSMTADIQRFSTWVSVAQGITVLVFLFNFIGILLPGESASGVEIGFLFKIPALLIISGVTFAWFQVFQTIKTFFSRMSQRSMGRPVFMRSSADKAAIWLKVGTALTWLNLAFAVLWLIFMLYGSFRTTSLLQGKMGAAALGPTVFGVTLLAIAIGGMNIWFYWTLINTFKHTRSFMNEVADTVDARLQTEDRAGITNSYLV